MKPSLDENSELSSATSDAAIDSNGGDKYEHRDSDGEQCDIGQTSNSDTAGNVTSGIWGMFDEWERQNVTTSPLSAATIDEGNTSAEFEAEVKFDDFSQLPVLWKNEYAAADGGKENSEHLPTTVAPNGSSNDYDRTSVSSSYHVILQQEDLTALEDFLKDDKVPENCVSSANTLREEKDDSEAVCNDKSIFQGFDLEIQESLSILNVPLHPHFMDDDFTKCDSSETSSLKHTKERSVSDLENQQRLSVNNFEVKPSSTQFNNTKEKPNSSSTSPSIAPSDFSNLVNQFDVSNTRSIADEKESTLQFDEASVPFEEKYDSSIHGKFSIAKKRLHEDDNSIEWYKHKLHVFVFTFSGKPVFSRYGNEEALSAFTGTLSAITTKMASLFAHSHDGDVLRYMMAGDHCFAFIERGPLWVACISSQGESYRQLVQLMEGVYMQVLSLLTKSIEKTLYRKPSYNLRSLLGGTDSVVCNFISWHSRELFPLVDGFESIPLNTTMRSIATSVLKDFRTSNVFAAIIFAHHRVVALSCSKSVKLESLDIILLLNLLLSSTSLRQAESWIPVCLPCLNDSAFIYAYINFILADSIGFVCLTSNHSAEQFNALSKHYKTILSVLVNTGCVTAITQSLQYCPYTLPSRIWGFLELIHLLFFSTLHQQYFSTAFSKNYKEKKRYKRVLWLYYNCRDLIDFSKSPAHAFIRGKNESAYAWITSEFHLYVCIPRWKELPTSVLAHLVQWLKKHISFLFITDIPAIKV